MKIKLQSHELNISLKDWVQCDCKAGWKDSMRFIFEICAEIKKEKLFETFKKIQEIDGFYDSFENEYEITITKKKIKKEKN